MKKHAYLVIIITCWVLLVLALVVKLFGANIFNIVVKNETFISFCDWVDTHLVFKYILYACVSLVLNTFCVLAILGQKFYTKLQMLIFIPLIIFMSIISWYSNITNLILGFVVYLLPIIWLKKRWYRSIIGIAIIFGYELLELLIRNIVGLTLFQQNSIIAIVMQLDTLIMSILYYLYSNHYEKRKQIGGEK